MRAVKWFLRTFREFMAFFLVAAFAVTCSFLLFFTGTELPDELFRQRAGITFLNVVFLAVIFYLIDFLRRKVTVEAPTRRILEGTDRIMAGDFTARIKPSGMPEGLNDFDAIIENLNAMAQELGSVETLRTDFIANVSHELKTPLAVIQNCAAMLQAPGLTEEQRMAYAKTITDTTRRFAELIGNLLKLNKLDNQQIFPEAKPFDLSDQLCQCLLSFENVWEDKGVEIEADIPDGVSLTADADLLTMVWNNLFSNAFKFTPEGGRVAVTLREAPGRVEVAVSDTGCGMDGETRKHIFDKFYQGDSSHAAQGNGLGLALVKRVMDIVGGEIRVESSPGLGSTFTVTLGRDVHGAA